MRHIIKDGQYRIGTCSLGIGVVGVYPSLFDVESFRAVKYAGADVETQWMASVNKVTTKMDGVIFETEWVSFNEKLSIYFPIKEPEIREFVKKIATDKMVMIVNREIDDDTSLLSIGISKAVSIEINRNEVLEWLELEDKGDSVNNWRPKDNPGWNPLFKNGKE